MPKKKLAVARPVPDEARWFEENQDQLLQLFEKAESQGSLRIGERSIGITVSKRRGALQKPRSQKVMLRIPADDLDRARQQAAHRGIGYQTYIKSLLHQALERQSKSR
jgi:predicted DNA binding CopG/RHH family protein